METRNKVAIGTAALALAVLGGGSLALWNDSTNVTDATVSSGHLDLDFRGTPTAWDASEYHNPTASSTSVTWDVQDGEITEISAWADFVFAPGDVVYVVDEGAVELEGTNLAARLSASLASYTDNGFTVTPIGMLPATTTIDDDEAAVNAVASATTVRTFDQSEDGASFFFIYKVEFVGHSDKVVENTDGTHLGTTGSGTDDTGYMDLEHVISNVVLKLEQLRPVSDADSTPIYGP